MRSSRLVGFVLLALGLSLVATGVALSVAAGTREIPVSSEHHGGQVICDRGDVIVLSLAANPTTGYDWEVLEPSDSAVVRVGDRSFGQDASEEGLPGAGGTDHWRVEAVSSGRTHLELAYRRRWETDVAPLQMFSLDVTVR